MRTFGLVVCVCLLVAAQLPAQGAPASPPLSATVRPSPLPAGAQATLTVDALPGAECAAGVLYGRGARPVSWPHLTVKVADLAGRAVWTWRNTPAIPGVVGVLCLEDGAARSLSVPVNAGPQPRPTQQPRPAAKPTALPVEEPTWTVVPGQPGSGQSGDAGGLLIDAWSEELAYQPGGTATLVIHTASFARCSIPPPDIAAFTVRDQMPLTDDQASAGVYHAYLVVPPLRGIFAIHAACTTVDGKYSGTAMAEIRVERPVARPPQIFDAGMALDMDRAGAARGYEYHVGETVQVHQQGPVGALCSAITSANTAMAVPITTRSAVGVNFDALLPQRIGPDGTTTWAFQVQTAGFVSTTCDYEGGFSGGAQSITVLPQ